MFVCLFVRFSFLKFNMNYIFEQRLFLKKLLRLLHQFAWLRRGFFELVHAIYEIQSFLFERMHRHKLIKICQQSSNLAHNSLLSVCLCVIVKIELSVYEQEGIERTEWIVSACECANCLRWTNHAFSVHSIAPVDWDVQLPIQHHFPNGLHLIRMPAVCVPHYSNVCCHSL